VRRLSGPWLCGLLALALGACQHVSPYQRGRLAHRSMVDGFSSVAATHMVAIHEGAVGGGGAGEAGCGCN
jgi:hypothetical protein